MDAISGDNLHLGTLPDDPTGVADCGTCNGHGVVSAAPCQDCAVRQRVRNAWWESFGGTGRLRSKLGL